MKTNFLKFFWVTLFFIQACGQGNKEQTYSDNDAIKVIKEFYSLYIVENDKSKVSTSVIETLKNKYLTESFLKKLRREESDYDLITNSQDYNKQWINNLVVKKLSNKINTYSLSFNKEESINVNVLFSKGKYKINGIADIIGSINDSQKSNQKGIRENDRKVNFYENNKKYFIKNIDLNKDGLKDKIISSVQNQGEELLIFLNKNGEYILDLKTINFSEDGGNQITDIKDYPKGFIIITNFLDKGYNQKEYYIKKINQNWLLEKILYKTNAEDDSSKIYLCNVIQNINMNNEGFYDKIKDIPEEIARKKSCDVEYVFEENDVKAFLFRFKNKNENNISDIERYKSMIIKFPLNIKNSSDYNDVAYYLEQSKLYNEAIFLLEKILNQYPDRTVAWLNIADAQFGKSDYSSAKKSYQQYILLMKTQGKDLKKIPQRVYDRSK